MINSVKGYRINEQGMVVEEIDDTGTESEEKAKKNLSGESTGYNIQEDRVNQ